MTIKPKLQKMQSQEQLEISYFKYLIETTTIPAPSHQQMNLHITLSKVEPAQISMDAQTAIEKIIYKTCQVAGVNMTTLLNCRTRKRAVCFARNLIVFFARRYTKTSLKTIARYMWRGSGKPLDHSTVIHCHKACQQDIEARCEKHNFYNNYLILAQTFEELFTETTIYGAADTAGN